MSARRKWRTPDLAGWRLLALLRAQRAIDPRWTPSPTSGCQRRRRKAIERRRRWDPVQEALGAPISYRGRGA